MLEARDVILKLRMLVGDLRYDLLASCLLSLSQEDQSH